MAGTKAGGLKTKETNLKKYGEDYYQKIGTAGGKVGTTGGFASELIGPDGLSGRQRAAVVGKKGGKESKRTKVNK